MPYEEFDQVTLKDGRSGAIIEVLEPGVAYLFEWATPEGKDAYDNCEVAEGDIATLDDRDDREYEDEGAR